MKAYNEVMMHVQHLLCSMRVERFIGGNGFRLVKRFNNKHHENDNKSAESEFCLPNTAFSHKTSAPTADVKTAK